MTSVSAEDIYRLARKIQPGDLYDNNEKPNVRLNSAVEPEFPDRAVEVRTCATSTA